MSGITPLLDTLLHQVLGRRVDIPLPKDLNPPVGPALPVEGARPLHSDSRLDERALPQAPAAARADETRAPGVRPAVAGAPLPPAGLDGSTTTSFSAAARAIADLLQRFPAPAQAIAPAAPLFAEAPAGAPEVAQIVARLQESIQGSGLFYESHVARWFRGELPLEALHREPQMQGAAPVAAAVPERGVAAAADAPPALAGALQADERLASADERAAEFDAGVLTDDEPAGRPAHEPLSALVRQQLELLAVPHLRWEGDVWAGVFMGLTIQAPPAHADVQEREAGGGEADEQPAHGEWKVRLGLRLAGHGALDIAISLQDERLALAVQADSASLRGYFEATRADLQARLTACGFSAVHLRLFAAAEEKGHG